MVTIITESPVVQRERNSSLEEDYNALGGASASKLNTSDKSALSTASPTHVESAQVPMVTMLSEAPAIPVERLSSLEEHYTALAGAPPSKLNPIHNGAMSMEAPAHIEPTEVPMVTEPSSIQPVALEKHSTALGGASLSALNPTDSGATAMAASKQVETTEAPIVTMLSEAPAIQQEGRSSLEEHYNALSGASPSKLDSSNNGAISLATPMQEELANAPMITMLTESPQRSRNTSLVEHYNALGETSPAASKRSSSEDPKSPMMRCEVSYDVLSNSSQDVDQSLISKEPEDVHNLSEDSLEEHCNGKDKTSLSKHPLYKALSTTHKRDHNQTPVFPAVSINSNGKPGKKGSPKVHWQDQLQDGTCVHQEDNSSRKHGFWSYFWSNVCADRQRICTA